MEDMNRIKGLIQAIDTRSWVKSDLKCLSIAAKGQHSNSYWLRSINGHRHCQAIVIVTGRAAHEMLGVHEIDSKVRDGNQESTLIQQLSLRFTLVRFKQANTVDHTA